VGAAESSQVKYSAVNTIAFCETPVPIGYFPGDVAWKWLCCDANSAVHEKSRSKRVTFNSQCVTLEASGPLGHVLLCYFHHLVLGRQGALLRVVCGLM
jgi:hypothetical protein